MAIKQKRIWFHYQQNIHAVTWILLNQKLCQISRFFFFYCCSRQSFLETNPHSRINKCWSESSFSGGWFAGQKFKLFCLSEAACSLLKHYVHPVLLRGWLPPGSGIWAEHGSVSSSAQQLVASPLGAACCLLSTSCMRKAHIIPSLQQL